MTSYHKASQTATRVKNVRTQGGSTSPLCAFVKFGLLSADASQWISEKLRGLGYNQTTMLIYKITG